MLDSESKSQLTLILNGEHMSVYATQFSLMCVLYSIGDTYVTRSDIDFVEIYPHLKNSC